MKPVVIIPARYASTRFPGKPLVKIDGKPMIQHVFERAQQIVDDVFVATDDERIEKAVLEFGGKVVMTSAEHPSGTDRVAEAVQKIAADFDVVVNVQGDEPFLKSSQIEALLKCFEDENTQIATLITPITSSDILFDENKVKVVRNVDEFAMYFSRNPIPYQRGVEKENWLEHHEYFLHLGIYGFKSEVLSKVTEFKPSPLEQMEKLEQLRWLEHGLTIKTATTEHQNFGIDVPEDLEKLNNQPF